ncbi:MAG: hypothetical protein E6Q42_12785 [Dechloromonas sp.]|nr:MAG: hypothetical protein E6Q42_12785 [Dechloromonas sp.]
MKILTGRRGIEGLAVFNGSAAPAALIPVNRNTHQKTLIFGLFSGSPQTGRRLWLFTHAPVPVIPAHSRTLNKPYPASGILSR